MIHIKKMKMVRRLAKPYIDWKNRKSHERYLLSPDHFYLKTLKGIHTGKRCFVIGNGPSLRPTDLDMLKGDFTFAANRIFQIFDQTSWRPSYYLSVDDKFLKEAQNNLVDYDLGHMFLRYGKCSLTGPTNKLTKIFIEPFQFRDKHADFTKYISEDVSDHFCDGFTVTYEGIQLAIFMGFKEIYLLGVDHNYSHSLDTSGKVCVDTTVQDYFDNSKYTKTSNYPFDLVTTQYSYTIAREYCDTHGIKIYNATRGGKLEVFERVDFDELMGEGKKD